MVELNMDIIYLILKELKNNKKAFCSCLLVNKSWSKIIIPFLWKNPWKYLEKAENEKLFLNVIISHLSDDSRDKLIQHTNFLKSSYRKPLFDYISFCKHLNLNETERIVKTIVNEKKEIPIIINILLNLFINENRNYTHLYIPRQFDYKIHLIPGAKDCFAELQSLCCHTFINDYIFIGLAEIFKSIKELSLFIGFLDYNYGIIKLIENQKNLIDIRLIYYYLRVDEIFFKIIDSNNLQKVFKLNKRLITGVVSFFVNLKCLELNDTLRYMPWDGLENSSLPFLQVLRATGIPVKVLTSLIENTNGLLNEIKIEDVVYDDINNKIFIQAIYKNCPNLKYLKLLVKNCNILELEILLIKCQYLNGLFLLFDSQEFSDNQRNNYDDLFKILTKSSPTNLFKFKFGFNFSFNFNFKSDSLKLFFDNWKGRHPMLLQFPSDDYYDSYNIMEKYKAEGIIKRYDDKTYYEDFEWIEKNS
ncbi:hypothetical protein RclHR1_00010024 [Rhizophagus clarus]|uniref:F-box domain-containing protein n=1 Tax=Rhizophagus clarus TaxID=94130 RepID=A0A2Z6Q4R7_9GLOM|nr:hypothetical protein RclHR1_00010024 [Rhizophagus clarus]GES75183.1 hypothetical protein GLOIN_2v1866989 [Rhizophagus clarus]